MNLVLFLAIIATLYSFSAQADGAKNSAFAGYTLVSQAKVKQRSDQFSIGIVDRFLDNFSLLYEYSYANTIKDVDDNQKLSLAAHTFMLGGQHEPVHSFKVWAGVGLAFVEGKFREIRDGRLATFHSTERDIYVETGFGNSWKIHDNYAVGIDWLIVSFKLQQNIKVKDEDSLRALKGPYFSLREEVETTYRQMSVIRSLRMQLSWNF
jgi:hypothetical protein